MPPHDSESQGVELKRLKHVRGSREDHESATDDDEPNAALPSPRSSSDSSTHTFELYTPDEEKAVLRRLDTRLVLFMSFLYLLSFLDRSSMFPAIYFLLRWGGGEEAGCQGGRGC